jgi:hypothetical protein
MIVGTGTPGGSWPSRRDIGNRTGIEMDEHVTGAAKTVMTLATFGESHDFVDVADLPGSAPAGHAYDLVARDLRSRLRGNVTANARAVMEIALLALDAVERPAAPAAGEEGSRVPRPDSAAGIADEIAREKLDP